MQKDKVNDRQTSAIDVYLSRAFRFLVIAPTAVAMYSAVAYTISYFVGTYRSVSFVGLVAFDITNLIYLAIALYFLFTGCDKDGFIDSRKFRLHKIFVGIGILVQWNFTAYLIPAKEFWAWGPFFALFIVFFFDSKLAHFVIVGLTLSTIVSYFLKPSLFVPRTDEYFLPDVTFRIAHLFMSMVFIYTIVRLGEKYLIHELEKYANLDPLTKLLNRRCLNTYMQDACKKAKRSGEPLSVMIMDIDDFKKVNDTYGHECGDEILKMVALEVSTGVKPGDIVFRWGGEEIFVILKTDEKQAVQVAERIRSSIENCPVNYKDSVKVSVTVTIGVSAYTEGATIQSIFDDVDNKLYYGKRHGKNRVVSRI